jgi:hypothetical protein
MSHRVSGSISLSAKLEDRRALAEARAEAERLRGELEGRSAARLVPSYLVNPTPSYAQTVTVEEETES